MDKNKSRNDLLAAGRKRLQQFRQKKDIKGSSSPGNSSKKFGKPEQHESDADAAASDSMSMASSQITDGKVEIDIDHNLSITETSGLQFLADSITPEFNASSVDSSSVAITYDVGVKGELASSIELKLQAQEVDEADYELSVRNEGRNIQDVGADTRKVDFGGGSIDGHMSAPIDMSEPTPVTTAVDDAVIVERDGKEREESLLLPEEILNTSLMQTGEGTMQDADGLYTEKSFRSSDTEIDGQKKPPLTEVSESTQSLPEISLGETRIEEASHEEDLIGKAVEVSSPFEDIMSDNFSASSKVYEGYFVTSGTVLSNLKGETFPGSSQEEFPLGGEDRGLQEELNQRCVPVVSVFVDKIQELSVAARKVNSARPLGVFPISDVSSINLLKLTEIISGLSEEEYHFMIKSRRTVSNVDSVTSGSVLPDYGFPETFESLREELFLANLMKDIFTLQLAELLELQMESGNHCYQLTDELSQLRASHCEINEKNEHLVEELVDCRVELHDVASKSVELQNQFNSAKVEVEALSARVLELENSFEMSQKDSLDLSTELVDGRGLVTELQAENKDINEALTLMIERKNKLEEEKEFHLCESTKLSIELADLKSSVEGLKAENFNLSTRLSLVTEERNMIETEAEHLTHEIDRLSIELVESKDLVASLHAENSNLNGSLVLSTDRMIKFEEDKQSVVLENRRLSSQTVSLQEQLSTEEGQQMRFEADLKEVTIPLEQLIRENIFLNINLDVLKAKIEEIGDKHSHMLSQRAQVVEEQSKGCEIAIAEDLNIPRLPSEEGAPGGAPLNLLEQIVFYDSLGFVLLNIHLDEMKKILVEFEEAIDCLHSESVFFVRSGDKVSSPEVPKLMHAFESKTHQYEHEVEGRDSSETQTPSDLLMLTKEQIKNLSASLARWSLNVKNVGALFKGERDERKNSDTEYSKLKDQIEALNQHCSNLEASNIELVVQYEAAKQLLGDIQEKKSDLEELCKALKHEDIYHKAKNDKISEKLENCQSKISQLRIDLCEVQLSSNHMVSVIGSQLENLQKEVTERAMLLDQGWNATIADIFEAAGKLDESIGETFSSAISTAGSHDSLDINHRLAVSVNVAIEMIEDFRKKLEAAYAEHEIVSTSYKEMNAKCNDLHVKNELAVGVLHKLYSDLMKLVLSHCGNIDEDRLDIQSEALPDLLNYSSYETIMKNLEDILNRGLELESITKDIKSELMQREKELEKLSMKCLDLDAVSKLVEEVKGDLEVEDMKIKMNKAPLSCLESLVASLVQKIREAELQVHIAKEGYGAKMMELAELQEKMHYLDTLCIDHENKVLLLKESLFKAEEARVAACSELQEKISELEQSEQRVSSIREKLSIAVAKGKGLVVQRDGLKQSLAETSSELERCLQVLQLKDARFHEVEKDLKTYAEAGERVEALESELSYIRNSANALRESFILKDSVLQRIEEILEDLDLPEQFHSSDPIAKIDWLARSVAGNSLPINDWDQKSSAGGVSYSTAFLVEDGWKDDVHQLQLQSDSVEDFRKNFEELQSKYYSLVEQNEMLEQSLLERNNLVQRWEELVNRIDLPSHLQSMETDDKIEWLGRALVEANYHRDSLQLKIEKYDSYCGLLNADLEESQKRVSAFQADLKAVTSEREHLSERMEVLIHECEKLSAKTRQAELQNEKLYNEVTSLEEKLEQRAAIEEQMHTIEGRLRELQDLVVDALQESKTKNLVSGSESIDYLEILMRRLIENYTTLSITKPTYGDALDGRHTQKDDATFQEARNKNVDDKEETTIDSLKKDLEEAMHELMHVKEERDRYFEKQISLSGEVEVLSKKTEKLQELLNQEEQKSASVREKLNVAVRKGKSLVQQRDSLKQTIEEMNKEMEYFKSEINNWEHALAEKYRHFSAYPDRLEALEPESLLLTNHLAETEHYLQKREYTSLGENEVGSERKASDPVKKMEGVGKLCSDLHAAVASLELESRKSKRASELLLAELNEVQERNDAFQEELARVAGELVDLRKERDLVEAAKLGALSHLENLSALHMEERKSHFSEIMGLKYSLKQLHEGFREAGKLLANAFFVDLESFQNIKDGLASCIKTNNAENVVDSSFTRGHDDNLRRLSDNKRSFGSADSWSETIDHFDDNNLIEICRLLGCQLQEFLVEVDSLKESIHMHLSLAQEQDKTLSELVVNIQRDMISQRESYEAMKKEIGEKDGELVALRENIAYLYQACANSVTVIEYGKVDLIGNKSAYSDLGINFQAAPFDDGIHPFSGQVCLYSKEYIKTLADRLLLAAKELTSIKTEILDTNQKEMKAGLTNLQREIQEKDVQRDRICMDLVNQVKDAEAAASSSSQDLQSSKIREHNLVKQVDKIEAERKILEQRVNELQDRQVAAAELEEKVRSQTDLLSGKDQEIESLMHALDEEEKQMEELTKKVEELEKVVQQKTLKIENLEASHGKVIKKLSITVSKFDELHQLSASLLGEVENLQSQLQERDAEISFLRQEITRCTNDVLASQSSNKGSSDEIFEFLMWVDTTVSRDGMHNMHPDLKGNIQVHEYKEVLHKKLISVLSELDNLKTVAESKDALLQVESSKVEELTYKAESLEMSLREKESRLNLLEGVEESGGGASTSSEILEVEPVMNKWTAAGTSVTPQVRSLRKGNNDHVAIAVDIDPGITNRIEDEDDDKVHGFKPLTSSKIVPLPRFTRPLTDMIDGLWMSCDRALMRQPVLRLGIIIYWALMHTLLAFFVV